MIKENKKISWKALITCFIIIFIVSLIGSSFTYSSVNTPWYQSIKPSITPPNWVFPIVWTILYILIALSMYYAWMSSKNKKQKKLVIIFFTLNLYFNILWTILYFGQQNILGAFADIILMWISIISLIFITHKINKISAYLLIPYLLWVSFAGVLNYLSLGLI